MCYILPRMAKEELMMVEAAGEMRLVHVVYKRIKRVYLRMEDDGSLRVSCPSRTPKYWIKDFVKENEAWIAKAEKSREKAQAKEESLTGEDGVSCMWLGERYPVIFKEGKRDTMKFENGAAVFYLKDASNERVRKCFYNAAKKKLAELVEERRGELDEAVCVKYGRPLPEIHLRYTTSQWGSCTPAHNSISLSLRLIHYPPGCLDYVMAHEYSHILVQNHSKKFWNTVGSLMEDYAYWRNLLKK